MNAIGIVTITGDTNLGNRLQNFALQDAIASLGYAPVETLDGLPTREDRRLKYRRLVSTAWERRSDYVQRLLTFSVASDRTGDRYYCPIERRESIRTFTQMNLGLSPFSFPETRQDPTLLSRYDRFILGSDQVWNPAFTHANPEWFLRFARPDQRIAYAASFGIPEVPRYLKGRYSRGLRGFRALSVREHRAATIVKDLTGISAPVVLDPTMLIDPDRWGLLAEHPQELEPGTYVATFMLSTGDSENTALADRSSVLAYARRHGWRVVDLHGGESPGLRALTPLQFIGAIRGAALVVTDSFHAAVFCTLFHRPYLLVQRGSMNSRFDTLQRHTGTGNRMLTEIKDVAVAMEVDWERVDSRLAARRSESWAFLSQALGGR